MAKIRVDAADLEMYKTAYYEKSSTAAKHYEELLMEQRKVSAAEKKASADLDALARGVIDLLGIRDAYPDIVSEFTYTETVPDRCYGNNGSYYPYYRTVQRTGTKTDRGVDRFVADVAAATDSAKGSDALKRIKRAVKAARS